MEPRKKIIITIDGWSSCGKSTLARQLARELDYVYIDSGAMYRAITLYFLRNHVDWTKPPRRRPSAGRHCAGVRAQPQKRAFGNLA